MFNIGLLFPVPFLKSRWKNLRAGLTRHLKLTLRYEQGLVRSRKPYYLIDEFEYLIPFTKFKKHVAGNTAEVIYDCPGYRTDDEECTVQYEEVVSEDYVYKEEEVTPAKKNRKSRTINSMCELKYEDVEDMEEEVEVEVQQPQRESYNKSEAGVEESNPEWNFFRSIMPDIEYMTLEQKRKMRMGFLRVIDEILSQ